MATKRTRQQKTEAPVVDTPPKNEFGEITLEETTVELSSIPTTEVNVSEFTPHADAEKEAPVTLTELTDELPEGESKQSDTTDIPPSGEAMQIAPEGAVDTPPLGVTKAVEFDKEKVALRVTTENNQLINRLQPLEVRLADYEVNDPKADELVEVLKARVSKHFDYVMGKAGFRDEKHKLEQLVGFADQLVRVTRLEPNTFFKVMDHIMTEMRVNGEKLAPTALFRFNIVTAKNHTTEMSRHNDFLSLCYKFAHNYADRSKLMAQIDFNKICVGRTVKEAELMKSYFRMLANS